MDLSIGILTNRQPELLPLCVASCAAEIEKVQVEAEIIIVDNASRDRYPQKLSEIYSQVLIIRNEENAGFSAGNNQAIRRSYGRYVLVLNDDAILQENSLGLMIRKLESDPKIGTVGPQMLNLDGSLQRGFTNKRAVTLRSAISGILHADELFDKWWLTRRLLTQMKDDHQSGETDELAGACLLVRREALDEVGLFDESFYYWSEDADLCWRLRKAGWKLFYLAEAKVIHHRSASLNKIERFERSKMFYQSLILFMRKHWHPLRYQFSKMILALVFLLRAPAGLIYAICGSGKSLREANTSARMSWQMARWLIMECK